MIIQSAYAVGALVAAGKQKFVAERMLGPPVVIAEAAQFGTAQMRRDIKRRMRQWPTEVSGSEHSYPRS